MLPETITPRASSAPDCLQAPAVAGPLASTLAEELGKLRETMQTLEQEGVSRKGLIAGRNVDELQTRITDLENALAAVCHER